MKTPPCGVLLVLVLDLKGDFEDEDENEDEEELLNGVSKVGECGCWRMAACRSFNEIATRSFCGRRQAEVVRLHAFAKVIEAIG